LERKMMRKKTTMTISGMPDEGLRRRGKRG
jgi:hypothetical protein